MNTQVQPYIDPQSQPPAPPPAQRNPAMIIMLALVALYVASPVDAIPFMPIDDIIIVALALWARGGAS